MLNRESIKAKSKQIEAKIIIPISKYGSDRD